MTVCIQLEGSPSPLYSFSIYGRLVFFFFTACSPGARLLSRVEPATPGEKILCLIHAVTARSLLVIIIIIIIIIIIMKIIYIAPNPLKGSRRFTKSVTATLQFT